MVATASVDPGSHPGGFYEFAARHSSEPDVILTRRRQAGERFTALGWPTTRLEAWRFTDLSGLDLSAFTPSADAAVEASALPHLDGPHHRLVFANGRFVPSLSRLQAHPSKAMVASLGQALLTHPELLEAHLDRLPGLQDNPFIARNSALWEDGAFIYLPQGTVIDLPLHLILLTSGANALSHPRVLIIMEEAAQAVIVEECCGSGRYLNCPVTEIRLGSGANLDYCKIQGEDRQAWHLGGLKLYQDRDSHFRGCLLSSGGLLARTDVFALLDGKGADCELNGLSLAADGQLSDYHIQLQHAKPQGSSRQLFKAVLEGKSRAVFDGLIRVDPNAQKTDASQTNRNLLLSKLALVNANPHLEILADDVKCSHGSSTGFLDADALFYLRSRGIGEAEAHAMLVYAFANDIIERIRLTSLRKRLEGLLVRRLRPDVATEENR